MSSPKQSSTPSDWIIEDILIANVSQSSGPAPKRELTSYHSPELRRTIMGGPGNRSSIVECSCGAKFDGVYEYVGHDRRMCDWYARHAGIAGGGDAVAKILRQYDQALDVINYPDREMDSDGISASPSEILALLRTGS